MRFYSGFCFKNEEILFEDILIDDQFTVAGFSKGAVDAFEYVYGSDRPYKRLQLISPAFFQDKGEKFKRLQLTAYRRDPKKYFEKFLKNVSYPANPECLKLNEVTKIEDISNLNRLLYYEWDREKLRAVREKGVDIEVFLGGIDKIIDSQKAYDFFKSVCRVYMIKDAGHLLRRGC